MFVVIIVVIVIVDVVLILVLVCFSCKLNGAGEERRSSTKKMCNFRKVQSGNVKTIPMQIKLLDERLRAVIAI